MDLTDAWRGTLSARRIAVLAGGLPPDSATGRAQLAEMTPAPPARPEPTPKADMARFFGGAVRYTPGGDDDG